MLRIVEPSERLLEFLTAMALPFSRPQLSHTVGFIDSIITLDGRMTLARVNRLLGKPTDQSALSDFFTYSTWDDEAVKQAAQRALVDWMLSEKHKYLSDEPILLSFDDSLAKKPKTSHHFELVEWHFDANGARRYGHGLVFLTLHMEYGHRSAPINWRLYLREKTVRKLNRKRTLEKRLRFKTKSKLAKEMLTEITPLFPASTPVFVMSDSWYSSDKLIKFCLKNKWDLICALKSNRLLDGKRLSHLARYSRNKSFYPVWIGSAAHSTKYLVRARKGYLGRIKHKVRVITSKRHNRDKRPEHFMCTEALLGTKEVLNRYLRRWADEVDHLYLKTRLGLEDFRIRSVEGITKYLSLTFLSLAYLYWRKDNMRSPDEKKLAEIISEHRSEHLRKALIHFGQEVLRLQSVDEALRTLFPEIV